MTKRTTYKKECEICKNEYQAWNKKQKFCSSICSAKHLSTIKKGVLKPRGNKVKVNCATCNLEFEKWKNDIKENKLNFCSRQCTGKHPKSKEAKIKNGSANKGIKHENRDYSNLKRGENHHKWKGGVTYFKRKGNYINYKIKYVKCPIEFITMARKDGYVMEHRLKVAMQINRPLIRTECVHHIDHNPENNNIENLMLFKTNSEHKKYEAQNPI
jgi:hypothetical protein